MKFKQGDKVKLIDNPLDEQLGQYLDTDKVYTVVETSDSVHYMGLAVKIAGYADWIDSDWFKMHHETK